MGWETPRSLAFERESLAGQITETTRRLLDRLATTTLAEYDAARRALDRRAELLDRILGGCDVLLTPAAPGEAPLGFSSTGDPIFNKIWTLLHGPCLTLPVLSGPRGLPVGVQIVGRLGEDAALLRAASFIEDALAALPEGARAWP